MAIWLVEFALTISFSDFSYVNYMEIYGNLEYILHGTCQITGQTKSGSLTVIATWDEVSFAFSNYGYMT